jgi:RimJ/RimL family protein N-acetyltransferase
VSRLLGFRPLSRTARALASGHGLELRTWDRGLVAQMAGWSAHGFPYSAFDLRFLNDPVRASAMLERMRQRKPHLNLIACEEGTAVGRVSVNYEDTAGLYLWSVHVPPEHEGRGVCRRMLATLIPWLQGEYPHRDVVLTSNTFAVRAHRAYESLDFRVVETRWQHDRELAAELLVRPAEERAAIAAHVRFLNGRWEVRAHVFRRPAGLPPPLRFGQPAAQSVRNSP